MPGPGMTAPDARASLANVSVSSFDMSRIVVVAVAASLFGSAALAQDTQQPTPQPAQQPQNPQSDPVAAVVGAWELSNADHDKTCRLNFRADTTPGGYKIDVDKNCPNVFPSTKDITAWTVDNYGSLRLLNAQGEPVIELTEVESGMYDGFTPEEGRYVMQSAAAAPVPAAQPGATTTPAEQPRGQRRRRSAE